MRAVVTVVLAISLSLAGCGGGSSGSSASTPASTNSGSSTPPPQMQSSLEMSATRTTVSAYAANLAPLPAAFGVKITNPPSTPFNYQVSSSGAAVASASFSWQSSQSGSLIVNFTGPGQLGAGTYTATVVLSVCIDTACTQPIAGSPAKVSITYVVNPGSQPAASFTVQQGPAAIASPVYTSQTSPMLVDFRIYVTNFPSSGLWLQITQPAGGPITSAAYQPISGPTATIGLTLESPATLGPGFYNASVNFTLCYDAECQDPVAGSPVTEPIDFTVSTTAGVEYTIQNINLAAVSEVGWDSANQELYATTGSGSADPDSLVQINPTTGAVGPVLAFSTPLTQLAISDDGQYAYVASSDVPTVYRVELPALTSDLQIPLGSTGGVPNTVYQMAVAPGASQTLAVSLDEGGGTEYTPGVALFDGASQLPNVLAPLNSLGAPAPIAWGGSASTLYALRNAQANPADLSEIDTVTASASGLALATSWEINPQTDAVETLYYAAGQLYGLDAIVRDASSGATLGEFNVPNGYEIIGLLPDPTNSRVLVLTHDYQNSHLLLLCYDSDSFAMTSVTDLGIDGTNAYPVNMILWGTNGVAFVENGAVSVLAGSF